MRLEALSPSSIRVLYCIVEIVAVAHQMRQVVDWEDGLGFDCLMGGALGHSSQHGGSTKGNFCYSTTVRHACMQKGMVLGSAQSADGKVLFLCEHTHALHITHVWHCKPPT